MVVPFRRSRRFIEMQDARSQRRYPIRVVSRRTGIKADTIRAWEKRYAAVVPERSETRRRLYSEADVERLHLLSRVTDAGWRIGQVANKPDEELRALLDEEREDGDEGLGFAIEGEGTIQDCLRAMEQLDQERLQAILEKAAAMLGRRRFMIEVLAPLLETVGEAWHDGRVRPVHEHLLSSLVRSMVGPLQVRRPQDEEGTAARMVVTTPRGQFHELGALMAAAVADEEGWAVTYLGPNLPAEEIALAAYRQPTRVVALGMTYPPDDPSLAGELRRLARLLPKGVEVLVGGRAAEAYRRVLDEIGATSIQELDVLQSHLREMRTAV